jgi:uncharacterized protein (DUF2141 family)
MRIIKNIHWLLYSLFVLACARQTTPTGGPKDSIPPTLTNSIPKQGQVNFKSKSIELTFSEDVLLNNPREQLIITPDVGKPPEAKSKKNQVILQFENDLNDSTTYSINFRESVQDITEKNPALNLKLAFSTGSYLDSLSIEGNIVDLLEDKEIKDGTVALYAADTFDIFKHRPSYFAKSDAKGNFRLENLKPGIYFIYGIEDKNKNLIVDSRTESYGFQRTPIELTSNVKDIKISLVRLDSRPLKLTSARPSGTYFNIKTNKALTNFSVSTEEDETIISSFGEDQSNISIYDTFDQDSLLIHLTAEDSIYNSLDTTLYVKFADRKVKPEPFKMTTNSFKVTAAKGVIHGQIKFNKPVLSVNFDSVYYQIDSTKRVSFSPENFKWDSLNNVLSIEKAFDKNLIPQQQATQTRTNTGIDLSGRGSKSSQKPANNYQLYLGHAAFVSIELDSSQQVSETITPLKFEDTGLILVEVNTQAPNFLTQLLTKDFQVLYTKVRTRKSNFEDLQPGDYQIRLIIDRNNNGKWDPGNFYAREEPEQVVFYKNEKSVPVINLKANWEIGPLLIKH